MAYLVKETIIDVQELRNGVRHSEYLISREVNQLLLYGQRPAVVFGDEMRAFKIRKLRDKLQAATSQSQYEIQAYSELSATPDAKE